MNELPLFSEDALYRKADHREFTALGQNFIFYEFSIGFTSHRLLQDQFEDWFCSKGQYLADLDNTAGNQRRLRDLAWHIWFRGRPRYDASRPRRRISKQFTQPILSYRDLLIEDMEPLFEDSTFWLAERLGYDRDLGHIWKTLLTPLHVACTRTHLERLIVDDIPSPWRSVPIPGPDMTATWIPDLPSRRRTGLSITS